VRAAFAVAARRRFYPSWTKDDLGIAGLLTQARELADQTLAAAGL